MVEHERNGPDRCADPWKVTAVAASASVPLWSTLMCACWTTPLTKRCVFEIPEKSGSWASNAAGMPSAASEV